MADVYGGSVFTISALSSPNANTGFLKDRNLRAIPIGDIVLSYGTWQDSLKVFIRRQPRDLRPEFWYGELNHRAWPLQERILAPAVLHYGRDQLLWECNSDHLYSETGATEDWGGIVVRLSDMSGAQHAFGLRDLWDCIVDDYTDRQLSIPSDRLRALSGLASKIRKDRTRSGRYVAGLWESDLDFQLLWCLAEARHTNYGESAMPNMHISTWSWAHRNLKDKEQDVRSQQAGAIVASCEVVLHGFVQKVGNTAIHVESQPQLHVVVKTREYPGLPGEDSMWKLDHEILGRGPHYCIRMMDAARETNMSKTRIHYLLLEKVSAKSPLDTSNSCVYKRVGMLVLYSMSEENFSKPYPDILFDNGKPLLTDGEWQDAVLV